MYIGILYQQKINKGIQYRKLLHVLKNSVQEKRWHWNSVPEKNAWSCTHYIILLSFCSMICEKRIKYIYPILVCRGQTGNIAWGSTYFIILLSFCSIRGCLYVTILNTSSHGVRAYPWILSKWSVPKNTKTQIFMSRYRKYMSFQP